jgi:hypothetical protein
MNCKYCGKVFLGKNAMFCSMKCYKEYTQDLEEKLREVVERDPLHTKKMGY